MGYLIFPLGKFYAYLTTNFQFPLWDTVCLSPLSPLSTFSFQFPLWDTAIQFNALVFSTNIQEQIAALFDGSKYSHLNWYLSGISWIAWYPIKGIESWRVTQDGKNY